MTSGAVVRAPGRPRSERADRAIVDATLDLLAEVGPSALTVEEVASRAGVGKATIYRRFSGKDELVLESLVTLNDDLVDVDDALTTRDALVLLLEQMLSQQASCHWGRILPRVMGHARSHPELFGAIYDAVIEPRRERFRAVLRRGVGRGEIRPDVDVDLAVTLLVGPVLYRSMVAAGGRDPAPAVTVADVVDTVIAGLRSPGRGADT